MVRLRLGWIRSCTQAVERVGEQQCLSSGHRSRAGCATAAWQPALASDRRAISTAIRAVCISCAVIKLRWPLQSFCRVEAGRVVCWCLEGADVVWSCSSYVSGRRSHLTLSSTVSELRSEYALCCQEDVVGKTSGCTMPCWPCQLVPWPWGNNAPGYGYALSGSSQQAGSHFATASDC
jgi:hypothetical protein